MLRKLLLAAAVLLVLGVAAGWYLSSPQRLSAEALEAMPEGDVARGEQVFWVGGCASCHAADGATGEQRLQLSGGLRLETPFGNFVVPNISPHPQDGIGGWSAEDFANAMLRGVSPDGSHYYPAFPYASYTRMEIGDVADLFAFLQTLPAVEGEASGHELSFPYNIRRAVGLWKLLYLDDAPIVDVAGASEAVQRGRYLVETLAHCGECHTPRTFLGGLDTGQWLAGAEAPTGEGDVPNITPSDDGIGEWTEADIVTLLETGFTPEFDSVDGDMAEVVSTISELPAADREAIAAYLKAIPGHADAN